MEARISGTVPEVLCENPVQERLKNNPASHRAHHFTYAASCQERSSVIACVVRPLANPQYDLSQYVPSREALLSLRSVR